MTIQQEAAISLIERAIETTSSGESNLLIDAAYRLDKTINVSEIRNIWLEKCLIRMNEERN